MATTPRSRLTPVKAEAVGATIPFEFEGATYNVLTTDEWPYEALEAFEEGRIAGFLKAILGPEEHAAFKATRPKIVDVQRFVVEVQAALGISGN